LCCVEVGVRLEPSEVVLLTPAHSMREGDQAAVRRRYLCKETISRNSTPGFNSTGIPVDST
ncbi:MAG: hypothetical protein JXB62_18035, partial [Pirellulales bacterium]|nr:hypothetical protein [Pirellulales bacterium]